MLARGLKSPRVPSLASPPGACYKALKTPQPMNAEFVRKIWDLLTIGCEGTLQHGVTRVSRRPASQQFVALWLSIDFDGYAASTFSLATKLAYHLIQ
jgi:hypothetical protein